MSRLTSIARCGREDGCAEGDLNAFTSDRPWGPNNPRWQPFGILAHGLAGNETAGAGWVVAAVWVGDDPADRDGDPLLDSAPGPDGTRPPGACIVAIRAEAFAARSAHRIVTVTLARPAAGCGGGGRLVSWRESP
jgi:hypothetical protein